MPADLLEDDRHGIAELSGVTLDVSVEQGFGDDVHGQLCCFISNIDDISVAHAVDEAAD